MPGQGQYKSVKGKRKFTHSVDVKALSIEGELALSGKKKEDLVKFGYQMRRALGAKAWT